MATLFRKPRAVVDAHPRTAIIDIGSNSIRLVVYQGPARMPSILFNEKVMAGLGRGLAATGAIDAAAMARAQDALARFAALAEAIEVSDVRTVATAAVRDASNGGELIDHATAIGLDVELLSGDEEAQASGQGVLSGIPDADGIVGDLGGGSLELVRVRGGEVGERVSFPLGVLRVADVRAKGKNALDRLVLKLLRKSGWEGAGAERPFYLVGGSWRSLARLDMHLTGYELPIAHHYEMSAPTISRLARAIAHLDKARLREVPDLSSARIPTLSDAAAVLGSVLRHLGSATTIVSAYGLREGLLYGALDDETRREDPLIVATREEGRRLGRFAEHGDLLDRWIAPLFEDDDADLARLRHAACLLADVGWHANPEFRAERGLDAALHGNWVAIDARGRALVAQALFTGLGGGTRSPAPLGGLAGEGDLRHAICWGLAIRLGQRLSGGVAGPLNRARLGREGGAVALTLLESDAALYGETVERRHKSLAAMLGGDARLLLA
ncbi:Ppx/GppA phosphatase family protein [Hephaestia mangrovi]|uniref:Ppx/GppA phosphatase family protein n=1 Tax=Hephaestia mangrovi TaxID=2873268 RepID=UPI0034E19656